MVRLGFLSHHNPLDKNTFSSSAHFMWRALADNPNCTIRLLGNHRPPRPILDKLRRPPSGPGNLSKDAFHGLDAVLSLVSTDLVVTCAQQTNVPIIHCTDATPGFLQEFYGYNLQPEAFQYECLAYEMADIILFSSDYMRSRAMAEFGGAFAAKMASIPWGANLESFPITPPSKPPLHPLRLLFIGKDWERKGGPIAIDTLKEVQRRGYTAELHVVGTEATGIERMEQVINHGYLNKNCRKDRMLLESLLTKSHFLLLPTRADCTPMVLAEANSYGLPVLTTNVGGIPSLVVTGRNGEMLSPEAAGGYYADRLIAWSRDQSEYEVLSKSSFQHFMRNLTWSAWSEAILRLVNERLANQRANAE